MWKHGLLGCFDNLGLCIVTYVIPCYTFGKNAEAVGEGCCCCGEQNKKLSIMFYFQVENPKSQTRIYTQLLSDSVRYRRICMTFVKFLLLTTKKETSHNPWYIQLEKRQLLFQRTQPHFNFLVKAHVILLNLPLRKSNDTIDIMH